MKWGQTRQRPFGCQNKYCVGGATSWSSNWLYANSLTNNKQSTAGSKAGAASLSTRRACASQWEVSRCANKMFKKIIYHWSLSRPCSTLGKVLALEAVMLEGQVLCPGPEIFGQNGLVIWGNIPEKYQK